MEDRSANDGGSTPLDTLLGALHSIRKHWALILATLLLAGGGALAYSKTLPKIYQASTMIEFDPDTIKPLGNKTDPLVGWSAIWDTREYYETQYRIMTSEKVLSIVVRDLGLQNDPAFLGYTPTTPALMENTVAALRGRLAIEPVKGSRLVNITIRDRSPAQARRLSEAVAKAYITHNLEKMISATGDTVVWLSGQLDHFKHELDQTENSLHEFKRANDLPSSTIDDLSKMIRMEMQEYDNALTHTRLRRQELSARHRELAKLNLDSPDELPASELLSNAQLTTLRKQWQDATRERAELLAEGKGENHPSVKKVDEKITLMKSQLATEIRSIRGAVERDLAIIQQQENGEASLYEDSRRRAVELNLKELEFHRLDRMRAQNEKLYSVLLEQLKEADLRRMMNTNNIRLVDPALEPKVPVSPNVPFNVGIGALVGLLIGIGLALVRDSLDNTLKVAEDIEKKLALTFLGLLPELVEDDGSPEDPKKRRRWRRKTNRKLAPELVVHEDPSSGMAEAARALRTNLMFMNPDKPYKRLLVTSAAPAEGKTTVAVSIAVTLAQSGQRVCIVDCDLRRPRMHRIFDRKGDVGLMNVILGDCTVDEAAKPSVVPNLWCIPCGPLPPNCADVVASEKFRNVLDELSRKFDRVVLDSPPVVAVTDSAILSRLVDGVVMVIRAFKTPVGLAKNGLRQLRDVNAPIAGAVLNAVDFNKHEYYAAYYYYRREGYAPLPGTDRGTTGSPGGSASADAPPPPN